MWYAKDQAISFFFLFLNWKGGLIFFNISFMFPKKRSTLQKSLFVLHLALKSLGRFAWPLFHLMTDKSVSHKKGHHLSPFFTHSLCFFLLCWKDVQKDHRYTKVGISDGTKVVPDLSSTMIARSHVLLALFFLVPKNIFAI